MFLEHSPGSECQAQGYMFSMSYHSPLLPVLQGRSSKLLRKWRHMEVNVMFELLGVGI